MSRHLVKIGNIRELQSGRGLGLGKRVRALTSQALDRGQAVASEEIDAFFGREPGDGGPGDGGGGPGFAGDATNDQRAAGLEEYLAEEDLEQLLACFGQALSILQNVPGREAARLRRDVRTLIEKTGGPVDFSDGSGGLAGGGGGGFGNGYVDVIGLDGSGGVATGAFTDPGEWR